MELALKLDAIFIVGVGATISAIIIFCGSIWLLLMMILGARLAYFVTASVTLAFTLIMALVWSIGEPLGPVGEFGKPTSESIGGWAPVDAGDEPTELDFAAAGSYPDSPWHEPDEDDPAQVSLAGELEGDAGEFLQQKIDDKEISTFASAEETTAVEGATRLLENDEGQFGITILELSPAAAEEAALTELTEAQLRAEQKPPTEEIEARITDAGRVAVVMKFAEGNPSGKARYIAAGTFLLLLLHLFGLSASERRARQEKETASNGIS
ncbi:MAG: hypothetical protein M3345_03145 [Actinomycetota bacterium]|nr:hypothetical protein [Actinomycetota bacterium]